MKSAPDTSQASFRPALAAISVPISFMVTPSQFWVRTVAIKPPSAGVDTADIVPVTGQPPNSNLSSTKKPQSSGMPPASSPLSDIFADSVSPLIGIHAVIHCRARSWIDISRLSAAPLAGSV